MAIDNYHRNAGWMFIATSGVAIIIFIISELFQNVK